MPQPLAFEKSQFPPLLKPEILIGVWSPLWGYFVGAALMGSAWWWMTRWMIPGAIGAAAEKVVATPVGGEAAPVSPAMLEAAVAPVRKEAAPLSEPRNLPEPPPQASSAKPRRPTDAEPKPH